jgi:cytochrome c oxidase subunit IV
LAVWTYLVVATVAEAYLVSNAVGLGQGLLVALVLALAATQVGAVASVYMHLRYEPRPVVGIAAASIFFAVLAVALFLASIGH